MKTGKTIFVLLMLGCLTAISAVAAHADWVICTVDQAGPNGTADGASGSRIYLTAVDPAGA